MRTGSDKKPRSWKRSFCQVLFKLAVLTLPSILLLAVVFEIAARTILPTTDVPDVVFDETFGNHFLGNQKGLYMSGPKSEIRARYRINDAGWNSPHEYVTDRPTGTRLIAVIGDSYVEAVQVDYDKSFSYLLEAALNNESPDRPVQVYSFGHSGANLAHYAHVVETVVVRYQPDLVIVTIAHNDFLECLTGYARVDNWSVRVTPDGLKEVSPEPAPDLKRKRLLRRSAAVRYLVVNLSILSRARTLERLFVKTRRYDANIEVAPVEAFIQDGTLDRVILHTLKHIDASCGDAGLLLVIDANRQRIYDGSPPDKATPDKLNRLLARSAESLQIELIDLTQSFADDWGLNGQPFEWAHDEHWNQHSHAIVADAILPSARDNPIPP